MSKRFALLIFLSVLVFSLFLRRHTFELPHFRGDQHHYVGLAFKLDTGGLANYNLRGIDILTSTDYPGLLRLAPSAGKGYVLESLAREGITYYDEPFHHIPFGFPMALVISHRIFAADAPYTMLFVPDEDKIIGNTAGPALADFRFDPVIVRTQFYAIIVPLFFSLLLIALVYFLAKALYDDEWVALTAMFLMAISPMDLLSSQKIWADDMVSALALLAALMYFISVKKNSLPLAFFGGVICGLSVITKPNGAITAFAVAAWHYASNFDKLTKKETFLRTLFDAKLFLFAAGSILAAAFWFYKMTAIYGSPIYQPHQENIMEMAKNEWFKIVHSRPKMIYFVGIPYQNPLFILAYLSPVILFLRKKEFRENLFLVCWLGVAFAVAHFLMGGEDRYMLPVYPAFAIFGAYAANLARTFLDKRTGAVKLGTCLIVAALAASALWSVPMALNVLFRDGALILKPF